MQFSPQEIKDKLIRALDDDNNVVDMAGVLEVISILESYPITREALEQTRIGRLINEMRKKVPKGELAKRSRNLVRNWQGLLPQSGETPTATVNGESKQSQITAATRVARLSRTTSPAVKGAISPALANSRSSTPKLTVYPAMSSATLHFRGSSTSSTLTSPGSETKSNISNGNNSSVDGLHNTTADSMARNSSLLTPKMTSPEMSSVSSKVRLASVSPKFPALVSAQRESVNSTPSCTPSHSSQTSLKSSTTSDKEKRNRSSHSNNQHANLSQGRGDGVVVQRKRSRDDLDCDNGVSPSGEHTRQRSSGSFLHKSHSATSLSSPVLILNGALGCNQGGGSGVSSKIQKTDVNENTRDPYTCKFIPSQYTNSAEATPRSHSKASSLSMNHGGVPLQGSIKSDAEKLKEKIKTPKVKTMAQILAEMQSKSSNVNNTLIAKIARVEREVDDIHRSVVPAAALPRARRKNDLSIPNVLASTPRGHKLSQTKTELVEKFLQTSVTPTVSAIDDFSPSRLDLEMSKTSESPPTEDSLPHTPQNSSANLDSFHDTGQGSVNRRLNNNERLSPTNKTRNKPWVDPFKLLQPINLDEINWDSDKYQMSSPEPVTDASVTRLHSEHWLGVNGCYDWVDEWHDWTETLSLTSYNGELLHILPYVNIDE